MKVLGDRASPHEKHKNTRWTMGKDMTENQRLQLTWVLANPECAAVNKVMQTFTGRSYNTGMQHKDVTKARQARDVSDALDLISFFKECNLFTQSPVLVNTNGMTAPKQANGDDSGPIRKNILVSMVGKSVKEFTFNKCYQCVTLDSTPAIKAKGEHIRVILR